MAMGIGIGLNLKGGVSLSALLAPLFTFTYLGGTMDNVNTLFSRVSHALQTVNGNNLVSNPLMTGAVVGTPGTLPSNWAFTLASGLSYQILGYNTVNGMTAIRLRVYGTTTAAGQVVVYYDSNPTSTAVYGQRFINSLYVGLNSGSLSGTSFGIGLNEYSSSGIYLSGSSTNIAITSSLNYFSNIRTVNSATTNLIKPYIVTTVATATAIDFTFDIALPRVDNMDYIWGYAPNNMIRNSMMVGATTTSTPNYWALGSVPGLSSQIIGVGTSPGGLPYQDIRFYGTTTAVLNGTTLIAADSNALISGTLGQTWISSVYVTLVAGSYTNATLSMATVENNSSGTGLTTHNTNITSTSSIDNSRIYNLATLISSSTAYINLRVLISAPSGVAIDFTLRIAAPQLELVTSAQTLPSTFNPTSGSAYYGPRLEYVPITNLNRNSVMQGSTLGINGTYATGWVPLYSTYGININVVGVGTINGLPYNDIQFIGTSTSSCDPGFNLVTSLSTFPNQTFISSAYLALISGSLPSSIQFWEYYYNSSSTFLSNISNSFSPTSVLQRFSGVQTTVSNTAYISSSIQFHIASGTVVNFTLRIAAPQLEQVPNGVTGPGDFVPTSGSFVLAYQCRGLRIEETRTNSIRNSIMIGGVAGSGGTLPTNWGALASGTNGLTRSFAFGNENGLPYIDIRFYGTPTATQSGASFFSAENSNAAASANGQTWAGAFNARIVGGSLTNIGALDFRVRGIASDTATVIEQNAVSILGTVTSSPQRFTNSITLANASSVYVGYFLAFTYTSGLPVDLTLRISAPQLELGAFGSSPVLTYGVSATRASETYNIVNPSQIPSAYSAVCEFMRFTGDATNQWRVFENTNANGAYQGILLNPVRSNLEVVSNNAISSSTTVTVNPYTDYKVAGRFFNNNINMSVNGTLNTVNTTQFVNSGNINSFNIGYSSLASPRQLNGWIRNLLIYSTVLNDAQLQSMTQ